jgi:C4-type Zn-finger protein
MDAKCPKCGTQTTLSTDGGLMSVPFFLFLILSETN